VEGLTAVHARITQIQGMLAPAVAPRPVASAAAAGSTGTFADALRSAQTAAPQSPSTPQLPGASGLSPLAQQFPTPGVAGSTRADVAAFKAAWPNGRVPAHVLTPISGSGDHRLAGPAAPAFEKMAAAAARDGVSFGVNDSYRSFDSQVELARRKGLYSQGGLAATPGTSQHGWGLAVDLDLDPKAQAWMRANGPTFGFHEDVPREPWHWTFHGDVLAADR
jgi:D-alanyl-D-alanine carboxypeptidase